MMKYPDFFIAGFPKSGTTALYNYMRQHNEIFMPEQKEPNYFCTDFQKEADHFYADHESPLGLQRRFPSLKATDYLSLFSQAKPYQITGEASVSYLYSKQAAENIRQHNPRAKIIISLRNPVNFIRSWYQWNRFDLLAEGAKTIREAMELESKRAEGHPIKIKRPPPSLLLYTEMANYYKHIKQYIRLFPNDQIKIIFFEEFTDNNIAVAQDVYNFLDVNTDFKPNTKSINSSSIPKHILLRRFLNLKYVKQLRLKTRDKLSEQYRKKLKKIYNSLVYKKQKKLSLDQEIKDQLEQQLSNNVQKLNLYLQQEQLISPKADLVKMWDF